jgi:hypothetical protein
VNALAGWLGNWSTREGSRFIQRLRGDEGDEEVTTALAAALQEQIEINGELRDELARLLESTGSIQLLLESLPNRHEQEALLQALQNDLRKSYLAQGEMHSLLSNAIQQLGAQIAADLRAVLADVQALHPAQRLIVTQGEFFAPFLRRGRLFNHLTTLVGSDNQLDGLIGFASSERHQAAILPGAGGIGKSKLLLEFAERIGELAPDAPMVRFVSDGMPITPANLNEVPLGPVLLLIDDGHRREDLGPCCIWLHVGRCP